MNKTVTVLYNAILRATEWTNRTADKWMPDSPTHGLPGEGDAASGDLDADAFITPVRKRVRTLLWWMLGFGVMWGFFAPLNSAVIASGKIVLDANKKTIQHLEGGLIQEILVKDGTRVEKGQPLIRLSETAARSNKDIYRHQMLTFMAMEDRIKAEQDGKEVLEFREEVKAAATEPKLLEIVQTQQETFASRRKKTQGKEEIINYRIKQQEDEIIGLEAQIAAAGQQIALLDDEIAAVQTLVDRGNAPRPRLLALQRQQAELKGRKGEYQASLARVRQSIAENQSMIADVHNEFAEGATRELRDVQMSLADAREKYIALSDVLTRLVITAPQSGIVTGLKFHTVGGVIPPGEPVMDIVPQDDRLVIESHVMPTDIDLVHTGLKAEVRFPAFRARFLPILNGTVTYVSADSFTDQHSGQPYYIARISADAEELKKVTEHLELYPGMPAEALIVTGERTFASYLFDPLTHSFRRAFREE